MTQTSLNKMEQMRVIIDYLSRNQPSPVKDIADSVDPSRPTVSKRLGELENREVIFRTINSSASPDQPRYFWVINPENARESEIVTDKQVEKVVEDKNYIIEEMSRRGLLKNPQMGGEVEDFLEYMSDKGYLEVETDELDKDSNGLSAHAHHVFMGVWLDTVKSLENIQIEGEISIIAKKKGDKSADDRDIHEEALYLLNDQLKETIEKLPKPEQEKEE